MKEFFTRLGQTFYSRDFYAHLLRQESGIGLSFILAHLVLSLAIIVGALLPLATTGRVTVVDFFNQMPAVTIKDNKLTMDKPSPYIVQFDKDHAAMLFDTERKIDAADIETEMTAHHTTMLVTSDYFAIKKRGEIQIKNYKDYNSVPKDGVTMTHDQWIVLGKKLMLYGPPLLVIGFIVFDFIGLFLVTFVGSLVAQIMSYFSKFKPDLSAAMRLTAAASFPVAFASFALRLASLGSAQLPLDLPVWLDLVVWACFVVFGLNAAGRLTTSASTEDRQGV